MDSSTAENLLNLGNAVFVSFIPEVLDFTDPLFEASISVLSATKHITIKLKNADIQHTIGVLQSSVFSDEKIVIGWNVKSFFTFCKAKTDCYFEYEANLVDLCVVERYLALDHKCPESLAEAVSRLKIIYAHAEWQKVYKSVYKPLIERVLPDLETIGIRNTETRRKLHAFYDPLGEGNGRLRSWSAFEHSYNPHSLGPDMRAVLAPCGFENQFMYFDFNHMEVSVLQWLSKDPLISEILTSGDDFYCRCWEILTGGPCDDSKRDKCKRTFLPVVYGCGEKTLSENLGIEQNLAGALINRIHTKFPVALNWVKQLSVKDGLAEDCLGRKRMFVDNFYKVRNFKIQSPAATFCLEKLVNLHFDIKHHAQLAFSIRDGYGFYVNKSNLAIAYRVIKESLESPSALLSGLALKTTCEVGFNLDEMRVFDEEEYEKNYVKVRTVECV